VPQHAGTIVFQSHEPAAVFPGKVRNRSFAPAADTVLYSDSATIHDDQPGAFLSFIAGITKNLDRKKSIRLVRLHTAVLL